MKPENRGVLGKLALYLNGAQVNASRKDNSQGDFGEGDIAGDEEMQARQNADEKNPKPKPVPVGKNVVLPMGLISNNRSEAKENSLRESIVVSSQPNINTQLENVEDKEN
jgi:hypothetical protein